MLDRRLQIEAVFCVYLREEVRPPAILPTKEALLRRKRVTMPPGEITVTCPGCGNRVSLPIAAVKRDNFYCSRCLEKIPMAGIRTASDDASNRPQPAKPKKSSKTRGRF